MFDFFRLLFSTDFMPHVFCLRQPGLIALHALSDGVIAFSYFLIPAALLMLVRRRRDLEYPWMFALFGIFILGCGATHVLAVVTLWKPVYRFDGLMKAVTAAASIGTAILLFRIMPRLMLIPSPAQLRAEIRERERSEQEVRQMNVRLEERVAERTAELEKANHELAESDLRMRSILDGSNVMIYVKDLEGRFTFVNRALTERLGQNRDALIGKSDADLFPSEVAARYRENDERAMREGRTEFTETVDDGAGVTHYVSCKFPLTRRDGQRYALCGLSTDITQQKVAEGRLVEINRRLQESEERFRQIAELVPDMLWSADFGGPIRFISKRFQHYTGMEQEEFGGDGWQRMVHGQDVAALRQCFAESIEARQSFELELRLRRADGTYRWFTSRTAPLCDENGSIAHWLGSFNDIDDIKSKEHALRRSNEELEQFAYAAAHDLQEPLRNVSTSLGMLRRKLGERISESEDEWIEESIKNARRMQAMVQDLLQYSRVVSEDERVISEVNAAGAIERAVQNLGEAVRESGARIEYGELPSVAVREAHLVMLFQNVIGNSIKYRKPGTPPIIRISATPKESHWEFRVADNGIGFDPVYAERIFKVFKRLHSRDEYPGNGIGLAVCARIVAHYGGRIWAESRAGEGATFYFNL